MSHAPPDATNQQPSGDAKKGKSASKKPGWREVILEALEANGGDKMKKSAEVVADVLADRNSPALGSAWRLMQAITAPPSVVGETEVLNAGDVVVVRCRMSPLEAAEAREKAQSESQEAAEGVEVE